MGRPTEQKKLRRAKRKNPVLSRKRKYNRWEKDAMAYHKLVMKNVADGNITEEQAKAELEDASKAAGKNLRDQGAPEQLANVVEQLIIYGSYDGMVKALKAIKEGSK